MADRRYTYEMCECGDPWCAGCDTAEDQERDELMLESDTRTVYHLEIEEA